MVSYYQKSNWFEFHLSAASQNQQCQVVKEYNNFFHPFLYDKTKTLKALQQSAIENEIPPLSIVNLFPKLNISNTNGLVTSTLSHYNLLAFSLNDAANKSEHYNTNFVHFQYQLEEKQKSNCIITIEMKPRIRYRISGKRECLSYQVLSENNVLDMYILLRFKGVYWIDILLREKTIFFFDSQSDNSNLSNSYFQSVNINNSSRPSKTTYSPWRTAFSYWFYNDNPTFEYNLALNSTIFQYTQLEKDLNFQVYSPLQDSLPIGHVIPFKVLINTQRFSNPCVYLQPQDYIPKRLFVLKKQESPNVFITQKSTAQNDREVKKKSKKKNHSPNVDILLSFQDSNEKKDEKNSILETFEASILIDGFSELLHQPRIASIVVFDKDDKQLENPIFLARYIIRDRYTKLIQDLNPREATLPPLRTDIQYASQKIQNLLSTQYEIHKEPHVETVPFQIGHSQFFAYSVKQKLSKPSVELKTHKQFWLRQQKELKHKSLNGQINQSNQMSYFLPKISSKSSQNYHILQTIPNFSIRNDTFDERPNRIILQSRKLRRMQEIFDQDETSTDDEIELSTDTKRQLTLNLSLIKNDSSNTSIYSSSSNIYSSSTDEHSSKISNSSRSSNSLVGFSSDSLDQLSSESINFTNSIESNELTYEKEIESYFKFLSPGMETVDLSTFETNSETKYTEYSDSIQESESDLGNKNKTTNLRNERIKKKSLQQPLEETISDIIVNKSQNNLIDQNPPSNIDKKIHNDTQKPNDNVSNRSHYNSTIQNPQIHKNINPIKKKKNNKSHRAKKKNSNIFFSRRVNLRFGQRILTFEYIPKVIPLSSHDIRHVLCLTAQQQLFLKIIGLKNSNNNVIYYFQQDPNSGSPILEKQYLKENIIYDVIVKDTRDEDLSQLTEDDMRVILDKFKIMDRDGSGDIDFDEVKIYYTDLENRKLKVHLDMLDKILKDNPSRIEEIDYRKKEATILCEQLIEQHIKSFRDMDVDQSGSIDLDEFIRHEGRILLARK